MTLSADTHAVAATVRRQVSLQGRFLLAVAVVGMVSLYWEGLASLGDAWSRPEYSHGYFIPLVAGFLLLTRLGDVTARDGRRGQWVGVAIVALGAFAGLLGALSQIAEIALYGLIVAIGGVVVVVTGLRRGVSLWVPVAYLAFMVPLPNALYWPLSLWLQELSSELGVHIIAAVGIPVYLDGNIIDLGDYQLQVAEACSGLRYLFPLMSFGFLFAVLYRGPAWQKALLFLSTIPITVLMNAVRIGLIGVAVDAYGIEAAEGVLHSLEGWIIFLACIALLYLEALALRRIGGGVRDRELLDVPAAATLLERLGRVRLVAATPALAATAALLLVSGLAWRVAPLPAAVPPERTPLVLFPTELADWQGEPILLDPQVERVLGADDYLMADYDGDGGVPVNLLVAYYRSQIDGSGIHSPEVCLPAGGWEMARLETIDTGLTTHAGQALEVKRAIIRKGLSRQLVYFWFEQRGRALTSDYAAKASTVVDSILRRRTDGALVRLVTPIASSEDEQAAEQRLLGFLALVLEELPAYVPE